MRNQIIRPGIMLVPFRLQAERTGVSIETASSRGGKEYRVPVILFGSYMRTTGNIGLQLIFSDRDSRLSKVFYAHQKPLTTRNLSLR